MKIENNRIMSIKKSQLKNWQEVKVGDYIKPVRGVSYCSADLRKSGNSIYLINLKNIDRGGGFRREGLKTYSGEYKKEQLVNEGDIVIAMTDLTPQAEVVGMPALIPKLNEKACISMDIVRLEYKKEGLDKKFLYYLLNNRNYKGWIRGFASGVNVLHLDINGITEYGPEIPQGINEQKRIASILSVFDDKIELNNKINQTLEQMAQAIFKEWFVKFNVNGKKLKFKNGVPEKWEVKKVKDLGRVITGKTPPTQDKENFGTKYPFITIPDIKNVFSIYSERYLSDSGFQKMKNLILPTGSICVSCIATIGLVTITTEDSFTNQQINSVIPKREYYKYFLYLYFKNKIKLELYGGGTAATIINKTRFENIEVILPPVDLLRRFDDAVASAFEKYLINLKENKKLSALRDLLLPKLMSGKIRVKKL